MSTNNYLKFITEEFVKYLNSPKKERREKKEAAKQSKSTFLNRWFGVLPFSFRYFIKGK